MRPPGRCRWKVDNSSHRLRRDRVPVEFLSLRSIVTVLDNALMDSQWVTGGFALAGVTLGWAGTQLNGRLDRRRASRSDRKERVVALMTACINIQHAVRMLHEMTPGHHRFRLYLQGVTEFIALADRPFLQQLAAGSRPALDAASPRRIVVDYMEVLSPHLKAFGEAAVRVSLLDDDALKEAAGQVNEAVAMLVQAVGSKERNFSAGEEALNKAVGALRQAIQPTPERHR